ncbi:unnamed protein product [Urochloa humidicola]
MPEIEWTDENTRIVCKLFAEQVSKGNRPNTYLNSVGYAAVIQGFKDRTGLEATQLQLKNKWDKLKGDFKAWNLLKQRQMGTGWDPVKGVVQMDDEWWKKAKNAIPGCGKFKKKPLQNEEQLITCFRGIISIGTDHWSPHGANLETTPMAGDTQKEAQDAPVDGEAHEEEREEVPVETPPSGKRPSRLVQNKGKKQKTGTALIIQEAVTSMASLAQEYASKRDGLFSINQVMEAVLACGAAYGSDEHYIATKLFVEKEQREMFMTMPNDGQIRLNWLARQYKDKYGN